MNNSVTTHLAGLGAITGGREEEAATAAATTMRGMATRPATWHALMQ